MKSKLVLAVIVCLAVTADAQEMWSSESWRPRWQVYALEGLGALGGGVGCGLLGAVGAGIILFGSGFDIDQPSNTALTGVSTGVMLVSAAVLPAVSGFGAAKAGEGLGEDGSQVLAIVGAYVGASIAVGAIALGSSMVADGYGWRAAPYYVLGGLALPAGAVVGYNLGTRRATSPFGFRGRLGPPAVALMSSELPDHLVEYGVKVQLAGLRF